jgi:hypothetical protein
MDVREILRNFGGQSNRAVARATAIDRKTVARCSSWTSEHDLPSDPLPPLRELQRLLDATMSGWPPRQDESSVEPYRDLLHRLRRENTEAAAIPWGQKKVVPLPPSKLVFKVPLNLTTPEPVPVQP